MCNRSGLIVRVRYHGYSIDYIPDVCVLARCHTNRCCIRAICYHQVITVNETYDEKVLYENDKDINVEVYNWRDSKWITITDITTIKQLPTANTNQYRASKGYDTLTIGDIWFTELHSVSGDIPEGLEDKAVIKITKVTLVSENVSFHDGTNTDIVRSTGDIKRVHIEYEVTNIDELRAGVQNKEELKQFIGGE